MKGGTKLGAIVLVAFCTLLTAAGQLLFKIGLNRLEMTPLALLMNLPLIMGFVFYGMGAVLLIIALKYGELSVLYPVVALSYVWVAALAYGFLDEPVGLLRGGGVLCILLGVSAIGKGSNGKQKLALRN